MINLKHTHTFNLTPALNSGEGITVTTSFIANGDPITKNSGIFTNTEIRLNSYGNCVTLLTTEQITPAILRSLADQLEQERRKIKK